MIAANSINDSGSGFGTDTNRITLLTRNDTAELPLLSKSEAAHRILDKLLTLIS